MAVPSLSEARTSYSIAPPQILLMYEEEGIAAQQQLCPPQGYSLLLEQQKPAKAGDLAF